MSGLTKPHTYDWKDSNIELFGSSEDKQVKKESAETEVAWKHAGKKVGLQIWRIVKFEVKKWAEEEHGKFYSGDSYIILNTYNSEGGDDLQYDIHFWIGAQSTQDEYGTAAYKTVELDTLLDDKPVQHREVEGYESALFKSYFKNGISLLSGGAETGFRHVTPEEYKPRLLHFRGKGRNVVVNQVALNPARLKSGDVFILDLGLMLYQWNGSESNKDERFKALQYLQLLKGERGKSESETLEEADTDEEHPFMTSLDGEDEDENLTPPEKVDNILLRVSDEGGHLKKEEVKTGDVTEGDFEAKDVFILDTGLNCFVWVGGEASHTEKQNGLGYAHSYLMSTPHPLIPIHVIKQGQHNQAFNHAIAA